MNSECTFVSKFYAKLYMTYKVTIFAIRLPYKHCNFCMFCLPIKMASKTSFSHGPSFEIAGKRDGPQPPSDFKDRYAFKFCCWTYNHTISKPNPQIWMLIRNMFPQWLRPLGKTTIITKQNDFLCSWLIKRGENWQEYTK